MNKLAFILLLLSFPVFAGPAKSLKLVGAGEMNWLMWKLYDIRLLTGETDA